jgi:hypothetical protein
MFLSQFAMHIWIDLSWVFHIFFEMTC